MQKVGFAFGTSRFSALLVTLFLSPLSTYVCPPAFTLFQLVSVGLAAFLAAGLLSALAFSYCHHLSRPSAESAVIHPSAPNHLAYNKRGNGQAKNEKYIPMEFKVGHPSKKLMSVFAQKPTCLFSFLVYPPNAAADAEQKQPPPR